MVISAAGRAHSALTGAHSVHVAPESRREQFRSGYRGGEGSITQAKILTGQHVPTKVGLYMANLWEFHLGD